MHSTELSQALPQTITTTTTTPSSSSSILHTYLLCLALVTCASICGSSSTTASWAVMSYNSIYRTSTTCTNNHGWIKEEWFIALSTLNINHVGVTRLLGSPQKMATLLNVFRIEWLTCIYIDFSPYHKSGNFTWVNFCVSIFCSFYFRHLAKWQKIFKVYN